MEGIKIWLAMLAFLITFQMNGAEPHSTSDTFDISKYDWLVGHWKGNGFGGISEEIWLPAVDGTMMGMYRHSKNGKITFYEFLLLDKDGLKLKHFHPDLKAWEEKDDYVTFEKQAFEQDKIRLKGLEFERVSDKKLQIRLQLKDGDKTWTEVFDMERQS